MSVSAYRRFIPSHLAVSPATSATALSDLQELLQRVRDGAGRSEYEDDYSGIVLLALILVNAALNKQGRNTTQARLAHLASTSALSVVASMRFLIPHLNLDSGEKFKYVTALVPHLRSMERLMAAALGIVAGGAKSPSRSSEFEADRIAKELKMSLDAFLFKVSLFTENTSRQTGDLVHDSDLDAHVLRWSDIDLDYRSKIPMSYLQHISTDRNFWDNTYHAVVEGKRTIVKIYPDKAMRSFAQDLETLRTTRHSNLPSLFGFSRRDSSVPFIALSLESFMPLFDYLAILSERAPTTALAEAWKMVLTMRSTAFHLANDGMVKTVAALRDIVKSAVVDNTGKLILAPRGLPSGHPNGTWDLPLELPLSSHSIDDVLRSTYADDRTHQSLEYVDHIPRVLRPVRYALEGSRSVPLPPSSTHLGDAITQLLSPNRWRALSATNRLIQWPIFTDNDHYRPVVGDIGRFSRDTSGQLFFEKFSNVQTEIGGYILEDEEAYERISQNVWRFPFPMTTYFDRLSNIPVATALNFLSLNAQNIGQEHATLPANLVLVTETEVIVRWSEEDLAVSLDMLDGLDDEPVVDAEAHKQEGGSFVFLHLSDEGHVLQVYQSHSLIPVNIDGLPLLSLSMFDSTPVDIGSLRPAAYVQIDNHELCADLDTPPTAPDFTIGDIGYPTKEVGGERQLHVACNVSPDLIQVRIKPWERNGCQDIGGGVWRSLPITGEEERTFCFSWSVRGSLGLPYDLEPFYLNFLASHGGMEHPLAASRGSEMVKDVFHQVHFAFSPQAGGIPLWVFVHFDDFARPIHAYWSQSDQPNNIPTEPEVLPGCNARILPGEATGYYDSSDHESRSHLGHNYRRVKGRCQVPLNAIPHRFVGRRIGDIGFWKLDSSGKPSDSWEQLGNIASPVQRKVTRSKSTVLDGYPCYEITEGLWKSTIRCYPEQLGDYSWTARVHSQWTEAMAPGDGSLLTLVEALAKENYINPEEILIVSQIVTDVRASVSADGFKQNDRNWGERWDEYMAVKDRQDSDEHPRPLVKRSAGGRTRTGDGFGTSSDDSDIESGDSEGADRIIMNRSPDDWDLSFYVVFPPGGGCLGFWSCDEYEEANYSALSRIDLEGWQRPGCDVSVSLDVKRTSVIGHIGRI